MHRVINIKWAHGKFQFHFHSSLAIIILNFFRFSYTDLMRRCLKKRRKNSHFLPHQRVIEIEPNMNFAEDDESDDFLESCNTFTNLLSRNFCDDDNTLLASKTKHMNNHFHFQNSYQSSRTNSSSLAQPRKRADTLGSASLTVAAALNINLSSLGPLYSSPTAARKESSSSSSNRVSRAPSPAPENNRFTN